MDMCGDGGQCMLGRSRGVYGLVGVQSMADLQIFALMSVSPGQMWFGVAAPEECCGVQDLRIETCCHGHETSSGMCLC